MRLSVKISIIFVGAAAVLTLMVAWLSVRYAGDLLMANKGQENQLMAQQVLAKVDRLFNDCVADIKVVASDDGVIEALAGSRPADTSRVNRHLNELLGFWGVWNSFELVGVDGAVAAATDVSQVGSPLGAGTAADQAFQVVLTRPGVYRSGVVNQGESIGPEMLFAVQVIDRQAAEPEVVGVVIGHVAVVVIDEILEQIAAPALFISRTGDLVAVNGREKPGRRGDELPSRTVLAAVVARGAGREVVTAEGSILDESAVAGYATERGHDQYVGQGWTAVVETPMSDLSADIRRLALFITVLLLPFLLFVFGLVLVLIIYLVIRPTQSLTQTVKLVTTGDLSRRSNIRSRDEFGILARSFNEMAERLEVLQHNLSEEVGRKSREIKRKLVELAARNKEKEQTEARLRVQLRSQAVLAGIGRRLIMGEDLPATLNTAAASARRVLDAAGVHILEVAADKQTVILFGQDGCQCDLTSIRPGGLSAFALASPNAVISDDLARDDRFELESELRALGVASAVYVPIRSEAGVVGLFSVTAKRPHAFSSADVSFVSALADLIGMTIERRRAAAKVRELGTLRSRIIRIVSREFRTPLTVVRWNLTALLTGRVGRLLDQQQEFIRVMEDAVVSVYSRVNDLLTSLDIEEGRLTFKKDRFRLEDVWAASRALFEGRFRTKRVELSFTPVTAATAEVAADEEKIRDVIDKLLDNALTYTPAGGRVAVSVGTTPKGWARFEVTDSGIGIPSREQSRIFDLFFRASNAVFGKTEASGLGLYIVKHYVEKQGGQMGFKSKLGKGSTFWFELPPA